MHSSTTLAWIKGKSIFSVDVAEHDSDGSPLIIGFKLTFTDGTAVFVDSGGMQDVSSSLTVVICDPNKSVHEAAEENFQRHLASITPIDQGAKR